VSERPRLLVLDLLETFARERNMNVRLERDERDEWACVLMVSRVGPTFRGHAYTAREAVAEALRQAGADLPR